MVETVVMGSDNQGGKGAAMGQYDCHVFVCTSGETKWL